MNLQELISKLKEKQKPDPEKAQAFLEKIKNWRDNNGNKNC